MEEDESEEDSERTKPILLQVADSDAEKHLARDLLQYNNNTVLTRSIDVLQVEVRVLYNAHMTSANATSEKM